MTTESEDQPRKVFIVLEHPDMTYYGDAEIHGVFATREAAEAKAREVDPKWTGTEWDRYSVNEWDVADSQDQSEQ